MIVILGLDGLEYDYVEKFGCKNLKQRFYGKTDLSEFTEPRTMVLWSSFLARRNMEREILSKGLWDFKLDASQTFFSEFASHEAIDVPGYTYLRDEHARERDAMKRFFNDEMTIEEYDAIAFGNHAKVKKLFFDALERGINGETEILMGYFGVADVVGHASFGVAAKMRMVYEELDGIAKSVLEKAGAPALILSDHGMQSVGRFGDHSGYGFWSTPEDEGLRNPKITELSRVFLKKKKFLKN